MGTRPLARACEHLVVCAILPIVPPQTEDAPDKPLAPVNAAASILHSESSISLFWLSLEVLHVFRVCAGAPPPCLCGVMCRSGAHMRVRCSANGAWAVCMCACATACEQLRV